MGAPNQNYDRYGTAIARLIDLFREKPDFLRLVATYEESFQEVENVLFNLLNGFYLDTATGTQLDAIGAIVGADRNGASDVRYRIRIRARILLNLTSGTPDQILELVRMLLPGALTEPIYTPYYPAAFIIDSSSAGAFTDEELLEVVLTIAAATPAGVRSQFIYSLVAPANVFRFSATSATELGATTKGFSDLSQITGGKLTGVLSN